MGLKCTLLQLLTKEFLFRIFPVMQNKAGLCSSQGLNSLVENAAPALIQVQCCRLKWLCVQSPKSSNVSTGKMSLPFTESNLDQMTQKAEEVSKQPALQTLYFDVIVVMHLNTHSASGFVLKSKAVNYFSVLSSLAARLNL